MSNEELLDQLEELSSAEDFLNFFEIPYDQTVVHVNRLHILQRFHDYLSEYAPDIDSANEDEMRTTYVKYLTQAYDDFVNSSGVKEKVFKVFKDAQQKANFVPAEQLLEM